MADLDWTRFDALHDSLRRAPHDTWTKGSAFLPAVTAARRDLKRSSAVRLWKGRGLKLARTPDEFCDLWEAGYRP